jgi:hypothetical protein
MGAGSPRGMGGRGGGGVGGPCGAPHGKARGVWWPAIHATDGDGWCQAGSGRGLQEHIRALCKWPEDIHTSPHVLGARL